MRIVSITLGITAMGIGLWQNTWWPIGCGLALFVYAAWPSRE